MKNSPPFRLIWCSRYFKFQRPVTCDSRIPAAYPDLAVHIPSSDHIVTVTSRSISPVCIEDILSNLRSHSIYHLCILQSLFFSALHSLAPLRIPSASLQSFIFSAATHFNHHLLYRYHRRGRFAPGDLRGLIWSISRLCYKIRSR